MNIFCNKVFKKVLIIFTLPRRKGKEIPNFKVNHTILYFPKKKHYYKPKHINLFHITFFSLHFLSFSEEFKLHFDVPRFIQNFKIYISFVLHVIWTYTHKHTSTKPYFSSRVNNIIQCLSCVHYEGYDRVIKIHCTHNMWDQPKEWEKCAFVI